jgi:hypothetical protein
MKDINSVAYLRITQDGEAVISITDKKILNSIAYIREDKYIPKSIEDVVVKYSILPKELDDELNLTAYDFRSMGFPHFHDNFYAKMYCKTLIEKEEKQQILEHLEKQKGYLETENFEIPKKN